MSKVVMSVRAEQGPPVRPQRVALVNMPFAGAERPSIQCGLLKAELVSAGHEVDVHYLNLELAADLGRELYEAMAALRSDDLLGEWLFSAAAFGQRGDEDAYRRAHPSLTATCEHVGRSFEDLSRLRNEVLPKTVERWAAEIDWGAYRVVGFTSTFQQNVAALALARRIKERHPGVVTVFGGANFDGEMGPEYVRAFAWIDYAVVGEGDVALPELVARVGRGQPATGVPGVAGRVNGDVVLEPARLVHNLDELPDPDYDDFFTTLSRLGRQRVLGERMPLLMFESARGCWWGQKHHCTFCGLNALGMAYRSRSPARVHSELRRMSARYHIINFEAVDNILDMGYVEGLCRPLIEERVDYQLFYEVKANLKRHQIRTLARAGVSQIQPGIESLSTRILRLMRKGTSMLQNVRLLKWAHYYGIRVSWNLLTGFPGETPEDYEAQTRLLPLLVNLPPPAGAGPVWLERFSPHFTDPSFPVTDVNPWEAYRFIYPEDRLDVRKVAYFFNYRMGDTVPLESLNGLFDAIQNWQERWKQPHRPVLVYQRAPDWIQVVDRRSPQEPRVHAFHDLEASVYEACGDTHQTPAAIAAALADERGGKVDIPVVEEALERFCQLGFMVRDGDSHLSLALPVNANW